MQLIIQNILNKKMTKKIIAFGGSSSKNSINKKLATYTAHLFQDATVEVLDLNDFEMPVFSVDKEENDFPKEAQNFLYQTNL